MIKERERERKKERERERESKQAIEQSRETNASER
jgi:hypothetical protein